jgi:glycosyltransferase involved in cell wall biosynthesis
MIACSQTVSGRIAKYYRRTSLVIPPPSREPTDGDMRLVPTGDYFLAVARLVPHKSLDLLVDAFSKLRYRLVIVGDGPERLRLAQKASDRTVLTGWIPDAELDGLYARCKAVIVPNEEDWGLTAVEAMSHGKPVLALRRGGVTETVLEGMTGEFFDDPIPEALADGVKRIISAAERYDPAAIRNHASQYGAEQFRQRLHTLIDPTA